MRIYIQKWLVLFSTLFFLICPFQGVELFGDDYLDRRLWEFLDENPEMRPEGALPYGKETRPFLKQNSEILRKKLRNEKSSEKNRLLTAELMVFLGGEAKEEGMTWLIQALGHSDEKVRGKAAAALLTSDPDNERIFNAVYKKLDDADAGVRGTVIFYMNPHAEKILPKLKEILEKDRDGDVRAKAAFVLGGRIIHEKKDEILPALRQALKNDSYRDVRILSVQGMSSLALYSLIDDKETLKVIFDKMLHDPEHFVRERAVEIFEQTRLKSKSVALPYFERLANKAIAGDPQERENAGWAILRLKDFHRDFLTFLSKVGGPNDPELIRRKAELISKLPRPTLLVRHPEVLDLLKGLTEGSAEQRAEITTQIEKMREELDEVEEADLLVLIKEKLVKKSGKSVCALLCNLYTNRSAWSLTGQEKLSPPLHFAMTSLRRLFFLKAAPFCPKVKPPPLRIISESKEIAQPSCEEDSFQQIKALASPFVPGRISAYEVYGKLFHLMLLQELWRREMDEGKKGEIGEEIKRVKDLLAGDVALSKLFLSSEKEGSIFHSSLLSSAVLAAPTSKGEGLVAQTIHPDNPLYVKYSLDHYHAGPKASVGRVVQANLVMYKSDPRNRTFRKNLINALSFYRDQFPFLMLRLKSSDPSVTHQYPYQLASYYLYASVPYATAAIQLLLKNADDEEKDELLLIKSDLKEMLLSLIQENGLFEPDQFIPGYENAMAGLALLPLAEEECQPDKKSPSLGILTEE